MTLKELIDEMVDLLDQIKEIDKRRLELEKKGKDCQDRLYIALHMHLEASTDVESGEVVNEVRVGNRVLVIKYGEIAVRKAVVLDGGLQADEEFLRKADQ